MTKGDDGKVIHCMLTIPYDDACIREIKLNLTQTMQHLSMIWPTESTATAEHGWARPSLIWSGRTVCRCAIWEIRHPQRWKAAVTGGDVKEAVKQGIETANDIEEGKVKQGFSESCSKSKERGEINMKKVMRKERST